MNTGKLEEPGNHAVKTDTTTTVSGHTDLAECRDVFLDTVAVGVDALGTDALLQLGGVVDTLSTGENLLSTEEEIEGVGHTNIVANGSAAVVNLGVEGTGSLRELVNEVEVGLVLLAHKCTESLLLWC